MLQDRLSLAVRIPFRRTLVVLGLAVAVALTLPAAGTAAAKPTATERFEARMTCAEERGVTRFERRMFRSAYGGKTMKRAMRRCVKRQARVLAMERGAELPAIRAECRMARLEAPLEFRMEYPGGVRSCVRMETAP
jgi:hypothetical protein